MERIGLLLVALCVPLVLGALHASSRVVRTGTIVLLTLSVVIQAHRLTGLPGAYAADVLDIQSMDVAMGRWVAEHTNPTDHIAVNDIGAISFFGRRPIVDLLGLATPAVAPFGTPRQLATLVPARHLAPSMGVAFTSWFASWFERNSLIIPLHSIQLANVSIIAGRQAIAFRADWPTFGHFYSDSLILALDPVQQPRTAAHAEDRLRRSMGLPTRSELFARAGDFERRRRDWLDAERNYRRALQLDPAEETAWSGLVSVGRQVRPSAQVEGLLREQADRRQLDPGSQEMLGDWFASTARTGEARDAWRRGLRLYPDSKSLLAKLERASQALGDSAAAAVFHNDLAKLAGHGID